jgi:site-specific DNA-methyltransferase (adenine-specific)
MKNDALNIDCIEYMRGLPDNYFDLAIADPPYGISADKRQSNRAGKQHGHAAAPSKDYGASQWDFSAPSDEWFEQIRRVSKNQIIWGANHFISRLPIDSPCWIVWDKDNGDNGYADCELAWTSFKSAVRRFRFRWMGMLQENMNSKEVRIHPTQKPVALYGWLLKNFAKEGDAIFDPMMGSQSSRIAAYKMGFDYVGCEIDKTYFDNGQERFNRECLGLYLGADGTAIKQFSLFDEMQ